MKECQDTALKTLTTSTLARKFEGASNHEGGSEWLPKTKRAHINRELCDFKLIEVK